MDGPDIVAQLHRWEADEHPHLGDPAEVSRGNGIVLWFAVDDFDAVLERVKENGTVVLDGPLVNANSGQREVWMRGPEGLPGGGLRLVVGRAGPLRGRTGRVKAAWAPHASEKTPFRV